MSRGVSSLHSLCYTGDFFSTVHAPHVLLPPGQHYLLGRQCKEECACLDERVLPALIAVRRLLSSRVHFHAALNENEQHFYDCRNDIAVSSISPDDGETKSNHMQGRELPFPAFAVELPSALDS